MTYDPHIRANGIGASDIPQILGLSPYSDSGPWAVALRKRFPGHAAASTDTTMQAIGRAMEPILVESIGGTPNSELFWRGDDYATPDGFLDGNPVECKVVGAGMAKDWFASGQCYPPGYVLAQAQWQMHAIGSQVCHVVAFVSCAVNRFDLARDVFFIDRAMEAAKRFRSQAMGDAVLLDCDASKSCRDLLKLMAPPPPPEPVDSTQAQRLAWYAYDAARSTAKDAEFRKELAYAELLRELPYGHSVSLLEGVLTIHKNGAKMKGYK